MSTQWGRIAERFVEDVVILDVGGRLAVPDTPYRLMNAIRQLVTRGRRKILLQLGEVHYIDSEGLNEIVDGYKTTAQAGGTLKICGVAPRIQNLFLVTKLDQVIQRFDSEEEALRSFAVQV